MRRLGRRQIRKSQMFDRSPQFNGRRTGRRAQIFRIDLQGNRYVLPEAHNYVMSLQLPSCSHFGSSVDNSPASLPSCETASEFRNPEHRAQAAEIV